MLNDAQHAIREAMIERLRDRLPGHTPAQRLALLRRAFDEAQRRCIAHPPLEFDDAGKPKPAGPREEAFNDVSDVLFSALAAILGTESRMG
jgi:hypothetical protein